MTEHKLKTRCPWCGYQADRASNADQKEKDKPNDGDPSICIDCGEWGIFDHEAKNGLRKPTGQEFMEISMDETCRKLRWAWVEIDNARRKDL